MNGLTYRRRKVVDDSSRLSSFEWSWLLLPAVHNGDLAAPCPHRHAEWRPYATFPDGSGTYLLVCGECGDTLGRAERDR